jgi:hypothetical protein
MSARTGIHEPGFRIRHLGPIQAGLIVAIAIAGSLGLALVARPAAGQGAALVAPTFDAVQFRADEKLPLVAPTFDAVQFRADEKLD